MRGIIIDIASRTGWKIEYINSYPEKIIVSWWKDLIYENWFDRGKEPEKIESDGEKFARILKESGAKLNG